MWYFSLNSSIRAGVLTKRSNLPIVSLWNVEWLAEEVSRGDSRSSECETYVKLSTDWSSCLWKIVKLSLLRRYDECVDTNALKLQTLIRNGKNNV